MEITNVESRYSAGRCASRSEGTQQATGEEPMINRSMFETYDASESKPQGRSGADVARPKGKIRGCKELVRLGTWNVRSMNQGKLDIVKAEMDREKMDLLGISEMRWTQSGHFRSNEHWVYFSGNEAQRRNGVAFILNKRISHTVLKYNAISDRAISIRLQGTPVNITIIQVYAPTADAEDEDIEQFYNQVQDEIDRTSRQDLLIFMGDLNAKVGQGKHGNITGRFGLGERNEAGDRLIDFCTTNQLSITNTFYQHHKRRLYTWTAPNGVYKNQIDYICVCQRWKSSIMAVKTKPGADCGTDHELLTCKLKMKLRKRLIGKSEPKFDLSNIPEVFWKHLHNRFAVLDTDEKEPEELWTDVKTTITNEMRATLHIRKRKPTPPWMSEETLKIIEERRIAKASGNKVAADNIGKTVKKVIRKDKEAYYQTLCKEIEDEHVKGRPRAAYRKITQIRKKFQPLTGMLKDNKGNILNETEQIKGRWKQYTEELYKKNAASQEGEEPPLRHQEPDILEEEVVAAIKLLSNNKAPGCDNIPIELIKPSEATISVITKLCQKVWETGKWPRDWTRSIFIPIPKKGDTAECSTYRTIALIPHASKILLKIIQRRLQPYVERELPEEQAGFRKGRGTRDIIADVRRIMESAKEYQKSLYMCFIDYNKAFDCVDHQKLWTILRNMGIPGHMISLIKNLYGEQEATVRTAYGNTEWFKVERGVRQGCILSPFLFNLYAETIFRKAGLDEIDDGIRIGGRNVNNLRYADDTTLIAGTEEGLKNLLRAVNKESQSMGLLLNFKKTKVMTTDDNYDQRTFDMDGDEIEVVNDFRLLGSMINTKATSTEEVKQRIAIGKSTMKSMDKIFKSKDISLPTKIRLVHSLIFSIVTYGSESWTIKTQEQKRIDAFEMWCWRRILSIPWTARRTNKSILEQIKPGMSLGSMVTKLQLAYFGHIIRTERSMEKDIMLGRTDGSRRRGRPATRWLETIQTTTKMALPSLVHMAPNRSSYRSFIHQVAMDRNRT